jgi:hypothetical protein
MKGIKKQQFDTVGFTGTQSESSLGTPSPRSGRPSPLHECLQFRVAAASEAANRNVGFTSTPAVGFARIPDIAGRLGERVIQP